MSLETWRKEYYPIDADKIKSRDDVVLIEASLLKWIGLQKGNLAEHGLEAWYDYGLKLNEMKMDCPLQCALCTKYWDNGCHGCPLWGCEGGSPYDEVSNNKYTDLTPLIEALAKALDKELDND